jgi:ABC-type sugar transport system permease subunit
MGIFFLFLSKRKEMERTCIIALVILVLVFLIISVALSFAGYKLKKNSVTNPDLTKVTIENATILPTQGYNIAFWTIVILVIISLLSILIAVGFAFQSSKTAFVCQT